MSEASDRVVGSIIGGALGDGWGRPFEGGLRRDAAPLPNVLVVSDDTQLTLATCEAIIERGRVDAEAIAARFVAWFRLGRLDGLGASTLKALRDLDSGAHWALAGAKGERSAGNGAAMRVAPLAFVLDPATIASGKHCATFAASPTTTTKPTWARWPSRSRSASRARPATR